MAKEIGESIPRPELFWRDEEVLADGSQKPIGAFITRVYVKKIGPNGDSIDVDCTTLEALPNVNAFRDAYGPGMWEIHGRSDSGALVAKRTLRIDMPPGRRWAPPAVQTDAAAPAEVVSTFLGPQAAAAMTPQAMQFRLLGELLQRPGTDPMVGLLLTHVLSLTTEMGKAREQSSSEIVKAIAQMSSTRIADAQDLGRQLAALKGGMGASEVLKIQADTEARLIKLLGEYDGANAGDAGANDIGQLKTLLETFREFRKLDQETSAASNVVPMQRPAPK